MPNPKNNSQNLIVSSKDADLKERIVVLAAEMGISNPEAWIAANMLNLVSTDVDSAGNTLASVYEYAYNVYQEKLRALPEAPGKNPGAVTDAHIRHALAKLSAPTVTEAP